MSCSSAKKSFAPKLWSRLLFQMSQAAGEEDRDDLLHFLGMNIVETAKNKSRKWKFWGFNSAQPSFLLSQDVSLRKSRLCLYTSRWKKNVFTVSQFELPAALRGGGKLGQVSSGHLPHIGGGSPCLHSGKTKTDKFQSWLREIVHGKDFFSIQRTLLGLHSRLLPSLLQSAEVEENDFKCYLIGATS